MLMSSSTGMWIGELTFRRSMVLLLCLTSLAKLMTILSGYGELTAGDPVLRVPYLLLFGAVSCLEMLLALRLAQKISSPLDYWLLGGFSSVVLIYRVALRVTAASVSCPCMGIVTSWMPGGKAAQNFVQTILAVSLVVMLLGSVVYGIRCYCKSRNFGRVQESLELDCRS